ncbi:MAG: DUF4062 domain-containing protein [Armatimonadetes bacterium]|nr:DUF4062 domain-containing protein [Armatimonadota bacterium]
MSRSVPWRSQAVFICSTFRDMQGERDYLQAEVFPELEERLRAHHYYLEPIDLRWGVETVHIDSEQEREKLVLQQCLQEIARSRPFFIGLFGERYGWVPRIARLREAASSLPYRGSLGGKSVTALEIEFGPLGMPVEETRCFFYFRRPLPRRLMTRSQRRHYVDRDRTSRRRLRALKARIAGRFGSRVWRYPARWDSQDGCVTGLEEFGARVLEDLWCQFEEMLAAAPHDPSQVAQDAEEEERELFLASHQNRFCGRRDVVDAAARSLLREGTADWGTCLLARAGAGKTAVLARLRRLLEHAPVTLLSHCAGASSRATSVDGMLRRWCAELSDEDGLPATEELAGEELREVFAERLRQAGARRPVIMMVDAIELLTPAEARFSWLPQEWPTRVRLLCTAAPSAQMTEVLDVLPQLKRMPLAPFTRAEAAELLHRIGRAYHRQMNEDVLTALLSKRTGGGWAHASPLWVKLAAERLHHLDADDYRRLGRDTRGREDTPLRDLLVSVVQEMPGVPEEVCLWLLARAEKVLGAANKPWVEACLSLLAVAPDGWRDVDLRRMLSSPEDDGWYNLFARLRHLLLDHLCQRGTLGQWVFLHPQLRDAVHARYLADGASGQAWHRRSADYLKSLPVSDAMRCHLMHHLIAAGDVRAAADYYGGSGTVPEADETPAADRAVARGARGAQASPGRDWVLSLLRASDSPSVTEAIATRFVTSLPELLKTEADRETSLVLLDEATQLLAAMVAAAPQRRDLRAALALGLRHCGDAHRDLGALDSAAAAYSDSLGQHSRLAAEGDQESASLREWGRVLSRQGDLAWRRGDLTASRTQYEQFLALVRQHMTEEHEGLSLQRDLAVGGERLGDLARRQGQLPRASAHYTDTADAMARLLSLEPRRSWRRELAIVEAKLADVLNEMGRFSEALHHYVAAERSTTELLKAEPLNAGFRHDLNGHLQRLGEIRAALGNTAAAREAQARALRAARRLAARDPGNTDRALDLAVAYASAGRTLVQLAMPGQGLRHYLRSQGLADRLLNLDAGSAAWRRFAADLSHELAVALQQSGRLQGALLRVREATSELTRLLDQSEDEPALRRDLCMAYRREALVLAQQGRLSDAQAACDWATGGLEELVTSDPLNAVWRHDLAVTLCSQVRLLQDAGHTARAVEECQRAVELARQLSQQNPQHCHWAQTHSICLDQLSDLRGTTGDWAAALALIGDSETIRRRLAATDEADACRRRDLAVSLCRKAEVLSRLGRYEEAESAIDEAERSLEATEADHPSPIMWCRDRVVVLNRRGDVALRQGQAAGALGLYRRALQLLEAGSETDPTDLTRRHDLSVGHARLGDALADLQRPAEALAEALHALRLVDELLATGDATAAWRTDAALLCEHAGILHATLGDTTSAAALLRRSLSLLRGMEAEGLYLPPYYRQLLIDLAEQFPSPGGNV